MSTKAEWEDWTFGRCARFGPARAFTEDHSGSVSWRVEIIRSGEVGPGESAERYAEAALDAMLAELAAKRGYRLTKDETQCPH